MNKYRSLLTIEYLPNELFLNVFQYINARDLHHVWSKLNKRFTNLVQSVSMYAHLIEVNDYKSYKLCFRYYPSQFIYIRIEQKCHLHGTLNLTHFSNIRSLHLGIVTCKLYDQITPENMPYLTHLTVNELQGNRNPALLLFGSKQFLHLTTCHLPYFFRTNIQLQPCVTLRSLHLNFCYQVILYEQITIFLPNLIYFESVFQMDYIGVNSIVDKQKMMVPHHRLRHLKIELNKYVTLNFLPLMLTVFPEIRCLEFYFRHNCEYRHIADLLQTKVPQLKQFNLIVSEIHHLYMPDIDILKQMSSWFADMKLEQYDGRQRLVCNTKK